MNFEYLYTIIKLQLYHNNIKVLTIDNLIEKLNIIVDYFYDEINKNITWTSNYTYDFAIVDNKPYFIEMNSFGKEYAAGSALFHWLLDEEILYNNKNNFIEFRYTIN